MHVPSRARRALVRPSRASLATLSQLPEHFLPGINNQPWPPLDHLRRLNAALRKSENKISCIHANR